MVVPIAQELRIGAERHILHQLVDDVFLRSPLDAQVFLNLGTDDAEVAGHGYDGVVLLGLFLDDDDLGAFFRRSLLSGAESSIETILPLSGLWPMHLR